MAGGDTGEPAADHYRRMSDDVRLMSELGLRAYRFSIAWPRVRPAGCAVNGTGLDFYERLVDELLEHGIAPWPTLYHWDLPQELEDRGGWANRDTVYRFADYVGSVPRRLGDRVSNWTTLNEPWCAAFLGYAAGVHAPGRTDPRAAVAAGHHLLLAHGQGREVIRGHAPGAGAGITLNPFPVHPNDPEDAADVEAEQSAPFIGQQVVAAAQVRQARAGTVGVRVEGPPGHEATANRVGARCVRPVPYGAQRSAEGISHSLCRHRSTT